MARTQITKICQHCRQEFTHATRGQNQPRHFCSIQCCNDSRRKDVVAKFNALLIRSDNPYECWGWKGQVNNKGYGMIALPKPARRSVLAHRLSFQLFNGEIPDGMHVLHKCDNPICCNPRHLFWGTQTDNMQDASAKGRTHRGERTPGAKLTEEMVRDILASHDTHEAIAARLGVSRTTVTNVRNRKIWKHVNPM